MDVGIAIYNYVYRVVSKRSARSSKRCFEVRHFVTGGCGVVRTSADGARNVGITVAAQFDRVPGSGGALGSQAGGVVGQAYAETFAFVSGSTDSRQFLLADGGSGHNGVLGFLTE